MSVSCGSSRLEFCTEDHAGWVHAMSPEAVQAALDEVQVWDTDGDLVTGLEFRQAATGSVYVGYYYRTDGTGPTKLCEDPETERILIPDLPPVTEKEVAEAVASIQSDAAKPTWSGLFGMDPDYPSPPESSKMDSKVLEDIRTVCQCLLSDRDVTTEGEPAAARLLAWLDKN